MTELAVRQDDAPAVYQEDPTGGRLVAWAQAASAANQLARALTRTTFVPAHFKGNDGDATAAILAGDELGLSPLASLRSIYVVHGSPALYARTMVALAQSHGHTIWTERSSDSEVVVCGRRRGSEHVERASWTIKRAQQAGYTNNKKYGSNPQEMLFAKASAEVARKVAADVLAGVPYSVEDLELEDQPTVKVSGKPAAKRTVKRARAEVVEPEPDLEPEADPEPEADATTDLITDAQMKKMHAGFRDRDLDRDAALRFCSSIVGATVESTKTLTKLQASQVIDALEDTSAADAAERATAGDEPMFGDSDA